MLKEKIKVIEAYNHEKEKVKKLQEAEGQFRNDLLKTKSEKHTLTEKVRALHLSAEQLENNSELKQKDFKTPRN